MGFEGWKLKWRWKNQEKKGPYGWPINQALAKRKKKVSEKRKLNKIKIQMAQKLPRKWAEIGARKQSP